MYIYIHIKSCIYYLVHTKDTHLTTSKFIEREDGILACFHFFL